MMGDSASRSEEGEYRENVPGLYLLATQDIFETLKRVTLTHNFVTPQQEFKDLSIWISFYEIYCGKLFDLLNERQQLYAREDAKQNVNIVGITEKKVTDVNGVMELIEFGHSNRVTGINFGYIINITGVTGANDDSSRSHAILQINIKFKDTKVHGINL